MVPCRNTLGRTDRTVAIATPIAARRTAAFAAFVLLAGACAGPDDSGGPDPATTASLPFPAPEGVDPAILAPLAGLGPCPSPPSAPLEDDATSVGLPAEAMLTSMEEAGPLTNLQGWLDWTPVQLRVWYQHVSELEVIQAEDEVFESEILLRTGGGQRLYVKAQAVCESASIFVAILAPEDDAGSVPAPAGSPTPLG